MAQIFLESGFSRLPVYEESIDHVVGVVYHKDYYKRAGEKPTPTDLMKEPVFIPPTMKIRLLLKQLQEAQSHIAIVTDESSLKPTLEISGYDKEHSIRGVILDHITCNGKHLNCREQFDVITNEFASFEFV